MLLHGSGQEFATSVASDAAGNTYVVGLTYSSDFPVTAGAFQTTFGGTCDAFVSKVGPDGKLIWSTYLGGILDDWASGVALDSAGNVLVTGFTRSANFPLANAIQSTLDNGATDNFDAFVAKLDPTGSKLLYSTFLGGTGIDGGAGIAADSTGNAYVVVSTNSAAGFPGTQNAPDEYGIVVSKLTPQGALVYSYFHPTGVAGAIALDTAGNVYVTGSSLSLGAPNLAATTTNGSVSPGSGYPIVFKISADGTRKMYETRLGGSLQGIGAAIAVDSAGEAWIAGSTSSADFPLVKPLQSSLGARPLWKSTNNGASWAPLDNLPFALPEMMVVDPTTPATLYEATGDLGVFKSVDGGVTWTAISTGIAGTNVQALAIDPVHPQTLYAALYVAYPNGASSGVIFKTVNGGSNWTLIDSPPIAIPQLAVDAKNPNIVWEIGTALRKSTDGGTTWNAVTFPGPSVVSMALDPNVSGHLFATSSFIFCSFFCSPNTPSIPYLYSSFDGGATWTQISSIPPSAPLLVDASTTPSTVYDGLGYRSVDGGVTWSPITPPPGTSPTALAVDPSGALYAQSSQGLFVSHDRAQTWAALGSFVPLPTSEFVPAGATGTLYGATSLVNSAGFVSRLSADGSTLEYSTYLRGHPSYASTTIYIAEPEVFMTQNWISAIVLDAAGNATVAGGTRALDFLTANPTQATNAGLADAFVTTISADGSKLNYSTYYGGSQDDGALAVGLDSQGNVILAGQTWSSDFPVPGGSTMPFSYGDAFLVKLAMGPPAITSVLNGASYQPGIEAGSWAMIKGNNLANSTRTWTTADFVGNNLPTTLDGVSVTIDGKPAFVYYISPTQINVQAPSDSALGMVNVLVTNNGAVSAPASVQLQAAAPAFFMYLSTNYAIASRLPDYAELGNPSLTPGTVAAKPGDTIVLWGTGFGATNPPFAAGTPVSGAPVTSTLPTVTVGGMQVPVLGAGVTNRSVGVYQVAIQLPANVPTGEVVVQASIDGMQTQAGVVIFVSNQ